MQRPPFVRVAFSCLLMDALLVIMLPVLGYLSILALLMLVPPLLAVGAPDALRWLRERRTDGCLWSGLASGMCGSALIYLILTVSLTCWGDPDRGGDIWTVILYVYVFLVAFRLLGSAVYTCLLAPISFFLSRGRTARAASAAAFLNMALGLSLFAQLKKEALGGFLQLFASAEPDPKSYLVLAFLLLISFLGGFVWGAAVQWAAEGSAEAGRR